MSAKDKKQLREFGLVVGTVFVAIGLLPLIKGHDVKPWALLSGGTLVLLGLAVPSLLRHPYRLWMKVGHLLMLVNTKVILCLLFFLVVCPTGILLKLFGKDLLGLKGKADTYWMPQKPGIQREKFEKQF